MFLVQSVWSFPRSAVESLLAKIRWLATKGDCMGGFPAAMSASQEEKMKETSFKDREKELWLQPRFSWRCKPPGMCWRRWHGGFQNLLGQGPEPPGLTPVLLGQCDWTTPKGLILPKALRDSGQDCKVTLGGSVLTSLGKLQWLWQKGGEKKKKPNKLLTLDCISFQVSQYKNAFCFPGRY